MTSGYTQFYIQVDIIFSLISAEACVWNEMSMQYNAELVSGSQLDLYNTKLCYAHIKRPARALSEKPHY